MANVEKIDNMDNGKDSENSMPSLSDEQSSNSWESLEIPKDEITTEDENKSSEWEDILGSGALLKKIIREGKIDTKPKRQMICTVNYTLRTEEGIVIEQVENIKVQQGDLEVGFNTSTLNLTIHIFMFLFLGCSGVRYTFNTNEHWREVCG